MRNAGNVQQVEVGWWPGDGRYGKAAFFAYAHPAPDGFGDATPDPPSYALEFARSAFQHACLICGWDTTLAASAEAAPPPVI